MWVCYSIEKHAQWYNTWGKISQSEDTELEASTLRCRTGGQDGDARAAVHIAASYTGGDFCTILTVGFSCSYGASHTCIRSTLTRYRWSKQSRKQDREVKIRSSVRKLGKLISSQRLSSAGVVAGVVRLSLFVLKLLSPRMVVTEVSSRMSRQNSQSEKEHQKNWKPSIWVEAPIMWSTRSQNIPSANIAYEKKEIGYGIV